MCLEGVVDSVPVRRTANALASTVRNCQKQGAAYENFTLQPNVGMQVTMNQQVGLRLQATAIALIRKHTEALRKGSRSILPVDIH